MNDTDIKPIRSEEHRENRDEKAHHQPAFPFAPSSFTIHTSGFVVDVIPSRSRASRCSRTSPLDTKSGHCKFFFGVRSSVDPASVRPAKDRLDSTQSIQENNRECCGKTLLFIKSWNRFHFLDVPCTLASCSSVIAPSWR